MELLDECVRLELKAQQAIDVAAEDGGDVSLQFGKVQKLLRSLTELNQRLDNVGSSALPTWQQMRLERESQQHADELLRLRSELRQMKLRAHKSEARRHAQERQTLLMGSKTADDATGAGGGLRRRGAGAADAVKTMHKARSVTSTLQRARQMMAGQMDSLNNVSSLLMDDAKTMDDTLNEHKLYDGTVRRAGGHLRKLQQRDLTDRILIGSGVALFVCVCLYVIMRRLNAIREMLSW